MEKQPIIQCVSVSKDYQRGRIAIPALRSVNLSIYNGEILLIQGRSGAGKSTLIHLLSAIEKPSTGNIFFEGQDMTVMSENRISWILRKKIGIIFQNFNLLPTYTVFENIEIAFPKEIRKKEKSIRILALLDRFHLKEKYNSFPSELSMGQQQKVAIVRCLAKNPQLIFADEPTGSVDAETAEEISIYLQQLNKEYGITIVIASHGLFSPLFADRSVWIENGTIMH